ncbi:hypothetical protein EDS67_09900 [candidate division KSB1 bacterium]|nr:MAG: hypothetical protein EDS67_09900 [candidate division KSB1 bacterium]MBC6948460.1 hypothetical protein [candidate division KSB1 bacterium]MCE7941594.1 hypothetical protein [Chlorobi bacterium CHB1]
MPRCTASVSLKLIPWKKQSIFQPIETTQRMQGSYQLGCFYPREIPFYKDPIPVRHGIQLAQ